MAALAEIAMSLNTQKPSPLSRKAWCVPPGSPLHAVDLHQMCHRILEGVSFSAWTAALQRNEWKPVAPAMLAVMRRFQSRRALVAASVPPAEALERLTRPSDQGKPMVRISFSVSLPRRKRSTYAGQ